jgi:alpha-L-fucosidase
MKRREFLQVIGGGAVAASLSPSLLAAAKPASPGKNTDPKSVAAPKLAPRFGDGRDWWFAKRFGMFVHWGLYSIHGFHEQEQWRARVPRAEYVKLRQQWNPVKFNPDAWLDLMEQAGMKYICLTTKHHDGFCLFESKLTSFNTMNSPYGKDVVRQLADACHRRGVPLCLYYSIADWNQKNYPNQGRHHELPPQPGDEPDLMKYIEFLKGQVRELCANYGEISGFWWDMNVDKHVDRSINDMIRKLQPTAVINDRGYDEGDFGTPERDFTKEGAAMLSFEKRTEACQAVGMESWGYRVGEDYYSDRHLERSIDKYLARDANYLLNVGPQADGTIGPNETAILRRIGKWYHAVKESFDGVAPCSQLTANKNVFLTRRKNTLYVHLQTDPVGAVVKLKPLATLPRKATLLNNGAPVECSAEMAPSEHVEQGRYLRLCKLPVNEMSNAVLVVKLEFEKESDLLGMSTSTSEGDLRIR